MDSEKKRYSELDLYKGIGIILTVTAASGMLSAKLQYRFGSVCFPLFMMAAGALWHKRGFKTDEKKVLSEGLVRDFMPFFWFTLIYLLIDAVMMFIKPDSYGLFKLYNDIWDSVSFRGIGVLGFMSAYFLAVCGYRIFRHNFGLLPICILLCIVAFCLTGILYFKGYTGLYDAGNMDLGIASYGMRMAHLFWRCSVGMFFCAFGEVFCLLAEKLKEKKLANVLLSVLFIGTGIGLSFLIDRCDYTDMILDMPFITLPLSLAIGGGLLLLCNWIGTVRPIDFLGRHAIIIFLTFSGFGILKAALALGDFVFEKTVNNFANRASVCVAVLVMEIVIICIFRLKVFSFLFGERDFSAVETEEDIL